MSKFIMDLPAWQQARRMKEYAAISHLKAQREKLVAMFESLYGENEAQHCIITRLSDDTSIWVQASRNSEQDKMFGKAGNKKAVSALGLCERLTIRRASDLRTVQLVTPAQVLPKALCLQTPETDDQTLIPNLD